MVLMLPAPLPDTDKPIVPHYICRPCDRRHSTRTQIGREHVQFARPPKRGAK